MEKAYKFKFAFKISSFNILFQLSNLKYPPKTHLQVPPNTHHSYSQHITYTLVPTYIKRTAYLGFCNMLSAVKA